MGVVSKSSNKFRLAVLFFLLAISLVACSQKQNDQTVTITPTLVEEDSVLNIYNWDTYIDPEILSNFEQIYGVRINYSTFSSNDELYEVVTSGANDFDIVVPSDYMVEIMRHEGLLAQLDKANIPNLANLDPAFISPAFDPGNRYCVSYQWGTMGIGYDTRTVTGEMRGWSDFFDPSIPGTRYLMDDSRNTLGIVLIYLGYSPNTTDINLINTARNYLISQADLIAGYLPDTGQDALISEEADLVFEWSGDIFQLEEPGFNYVIPREGSIIWTDNMCILRDAPHKYMAELFINYILDPQVGATLSNYTQYASPNLASYPLLDPEIRDNPAIYPPEDVLQRLFFLVDVGPEIQEFFNQAWDAVLASSQTSSPRP